MDMTEPDFWRWETTSFPGPMRRLVMPPGTRVRLRQFLAIRFCPAGEGSPGAHRRKELVHALNAETGRGLCIGTEVALDMDRRGLLIMDYDQIPDDQWHPLPLHPGGGR